MCGKPSPGGEAHPHHIPHPTPPPRKKPNIGGVIALGMVVLLIIVGIGVVARGGSHVTTATFCSQVRTASAYATSGPTATVTVDQGKADEQKLSDMAKDYAENGKYAALVTDAESYYSDYATGGVVNAVSTDLPVLVRDCQILGQ